MENLRKGNISKDQAALQKLPPDDFRRLPVIPTYEDIHTDKEPFLRPNIVRGRYPDVDTYLDVQFRLLREDFIRPLREGIAEFLNMRRRGFDQEGRLQDIHVYHGVHVVYPTYAYSGIGYRIQFDSSRLKGVRWGYSKRLIYGSLVCLSNDEFRTMHFATVVNREPTQLELGWVDVRFEDDTLVVLGISPMDTFIMVESSAFFEAYRHVLKGLQEVQRNTMPFTKHIVDCDCADGVDPPEYLRGSFGDVTYDMSVVVENAHSSHVRSVPVLQDDLWPSAEDLDFDESQYRAFKLGLTKEFAVIQGPPGTGKTYIGLKIIQVLLKNSHHWRGLQGGLGMTRRAARPILVVCYTNHALDQFLEGIAESYPEGIVRVGGQSKSEKLKKFNLTNIRHRLREDEMVLGYIHRGAGDTTREMKRLQEEMDVYLDQLTATQRGLLPDHTLMYLMDQHHWDSLMQGWLIAHEDDDEWMTGEQKRGSVIIDWLGLGGYLLPDVDKQDHGTQADEEEEEKKDLLEEPEEQRLLDDDELLYGRQNKGKHNVKYKSLDLALDLVNTQMNDHSEGTGGWQVQVNKKKRRNKLKRELSKTEMMSHEEVQQVQNVWDLQPRDRWRLYRYWMAKYHEMYKESISEYVDQYEDVAKRLQEFRNEGDRRILEEAYVIGMTNTGAAKYRSILQDIQPAVVIVEEAAEVLEAHIVTTLSQHCQHLILIGDHQQLRPSPTVYQLAKKYNMDISLFERMINNGMQCQRLQSQHRMRPEFARLLTPHIYDTLDNHESVLNYENIKGVSSNIFFVDHSHLEVQDKEMKSRSNMHEAQFLASFCHYLLQQGYSASQITVLTTYTGQLFNFKNVMKEGVFEGVRVCTVDNFQGEENDIILLSLVRSNEEDIAGFLKVDNRVCVALSRAKKGFYAIGNLTMLAKASKLWDKIIQELREQGSVGTDLQLSCQNHPESKILASTNGDFRKAPNGGCMRPCAFRLQCGHVCGMRCHPTDPEHEEYMCLKPCVKLLCDLGHKCHKDCYENCGECEVLVEKTIPRCQHKQMMPCHKDPSAFQCQERCDKALCDLGHKCQRLCGQFCGDCEVLVEKTIPRCQHKQMMPCHKDPSAFQCQERCDKALCDLGHKCQRLCGQFCGDCEVLVEKTIPRCQHKQMMSCYKDPSTCQCQEPCDKVLCFLGHKCQRLCGQFCGDCEVLVEKTIPRCQHKQMMPCHEAPRSFWCQQPCIKVLCALGHKCQRLCYQICGNCEVLVEKTFPRCQHKRMMPCFKSPSAFQCREPCVKILCNLGHKCQRLCYQDCGECQVLVEKTVPRCRHKQMMPCYAAPSSFQCQMPCEKVLPCRHTCKNKCGQVCTCTEILTYHLTCGHAIQVVCKATEEDLVCNAPCGQLLKCGHPCAGTCDSCQEGMLHEPCRHPCNRVLVCSHRCSALCAENCPPCNKRCENRCVHTPCRKQCGEPCVPCQNPCEWRCRHHQCTKPCGEPCDRPRCDQPCPKIRRCRACQKCHRCIGMCGEPCPDKCRVCDREEVTRILFGTEDEPDAQFVLLEDCGHILEVRGMDEWMDRADENVQLKTCPECKTPIQHNVRYGNSIKRTRALTMVEEKTQRCDEDVQNAQRDLEAAAQRLKREFEVDADLDSYFTETSARISQQMTSRCKLSTEIVTMYENKFLFLKRLAKIKKGTGRELSVSGNESHIRELQREIANMEKWLLHPTSHVAEQVSPVLYALHSAKMNMLLSP
ncbi:NFX1-type zinc finger-containing protein 1-like [Branchiostoma lanceolatum]|uniref:NFX1-type zinc finger-containing protein 1-like n=1 Tax=Branchiostoma lanceolatum TaxID=7740 RepID=UPI003452B58B